jgi:DUF971 family protein
MQGTHTTLPETIRLDNTAAILVLEWQNGSTDALPFRALREHCMCALCRSSRDRGEPPLASESIAVVNIVPYGANAVQLTFSDGHSRGIFPFAYLRALARDAQARTAQKFALRSGSVSKHG